MSRVVGRCFMGFGAMALMVVVAHGSAAEPAAKAAAVASTASSRIATAEAGSFTPSDQLSCSSGYYTCPDDGTQWDYASSPSCELDCGAPTKADVYTTCNSYCRATCTATEWFACGI